MTIDQLESDAKSTVFVVEHYGMDSPSQQRAYDLARAVLAMLPVVRLAEKYADADLVAPDMRDAIDSLRSSMARLAGDV